MHIIRQLLISIGRPIVSFIKTLHRFKIRNPKLKKSKIIYKAPSFTLKRFLKVIYPLISQLPKLHLPSLSFPRFVFRIPSFRFTFPTFQKRWPLAGLLVLLAISIGIYWYAFRDLPSLSSLNTNPPLTTHIKDRHGRELYKIYASENRTLIKLSDLPPYLKQATISIEDKDFYRHSGFSISGTLRALWRIIIDRKVEGGSTITQQLVKNALLIPDRTFRRKLRELILAVAVEFKYPKDTILEMYLNRVSFGGATYGIEEAAQTYFGKSAQNLSLAESALLAGLPASPTTYSPFGAHPELAKFRQQEVLKRMVTDGYITQAQAEIASSQELQLAPQRIDIHAPHFVMYIKDVLAQKYGTKLVEQGGLTVVTSLDLNLQNEAQKIVTQEISKVSYLHITNGAALVTIPSTGEILAMIGSKDYFDTTADGNVNVTLSLRQPGSSIKPLNYALALTKGFTPASVIDDSPISYQSPGQPIYSPVNYDGRYHGRVTLRTALASSYNIPAVKLLAANGVLNMVDLGRKLGISTWTDPSRFGLSLTLGGGEVTMLDMAVVYGSLANGGNRVDLHPILEVSDSHGHLLEKFHCNSQEPIQAAQTGTEITDCSPTPVLNPRVAYLISSILSDNSARSPAFGPNSDLNVPGVAVKTGTTNNLRDNWAIGYTPQVLTAVWVGNNDNSPMSYVVSGVTGASPIWRLIISSLLQKFPQVSFTPPIDILSIGVCTLTGELPCEGCPVRIEYFLPGTQPTRSCSSDTVRKILDEKTKKDQEERDRILQGVRTP